MAFAQHAVDLAGGAEAPARRAAEAQGAMPREGGVAPGRVPGAPARQPPGLMRQIGESPLQRAEPEAQPGGIELGEKELSLLRTLRNQAVMAFRQAS